MTDFFYRTEDIKPEEVSDYFAESERDRAVIDAIKSRNPTIIVGSRGVGKSFLLRVAQKEMLDDFPNTKVFPIYLTFVRSSLVRSDDSEKFRSWMLSRLCSAALRALERAGMLGTVPAGVRVLAGEQVSSSAPPTKIEIIAQAFEDAYKNPGSSIDDDSIPSVEEFKDAFEDISDALGISRFCFLIDEAAHIFVPDQQREFFTLFRDLRSHCISCKAAVYPGVTSYGETFQPSHDASVVHIERDVLAPDYIENMREIVQKQADSVIQRNMIRNGQNFAVLAYACSGNPRILLKTLADAPSLSSTEINEIMRSYYRVTVWAEHSALAEKYVGHKEVIDWGRHFIESVALPELKTKNDNYLQTEKSTSAYIWIHRDAPEEVKEALRILCYTGILIEMEAGIKASRSEIGKRYMVNLGCLFALESNAATQAFAVAKSLTPKRMTEYGANHAVYRPLHDALQGRVNLEHTDHLQLQLAKPIDVLDLTPWQKEKLRELHLLSIGDVLDATEDRLKLAKYVGELRARRMRNAAVASVLEYLSG